MSQVKFWRGTSDKFDLVGTKDTGTIYFVDNIVGDGEDKIPYSAIFVGNTQFASSEVSGIDMSAIEELLSAELGDFRGAFVGATTVTQALQLVEYQIQELGSNIGILIGDWDAVKLAFDLTIEDNLTVSDAIKSIKNDSKFESKGTADNYQMPANYTRLTYGDVSGKTAEQILDMMLFPDTLPNSTTDATISLSVPGQTAYMEIGASFNPNLTANYNQGTIQVSGVASTVKKYRGVATGYVFSGPSVNTASQSGNTQQLSGYKIVKGANNWGVTVNFGDGEIPISAKGNPQPQLQGKAGSKTSTAVGVTGVYPVITNKTTITALTTKESLVADSSKAFDITFAQANDATNRFKIAVENGRGELTKVELWNALSKEFVNQSPMPFEKIANTTIAIQGNDVTYKVFSCTETAVGAGARYRFTFA